jgi:hypothetical protein
VGLAVGAGVVRGDFGFAIPCNTGWAVESNFKLPNMNAPPADVWCHVYLTMVRFGVVAKSSLIVIRHAFFVRQREEIVDTSRT